MGTVLSAENWTQYYLLKTGNLIERDVAF